MTVTPVIPSDEIIAKIVSGIEEALPEVDLIMLDITPKPPATIEWE